VADVGHPVADLARRIGLARTGIAVAALPILLNWPVVTRRSEPEASLARETARQLLEPLPPRAVLFVEGDNDTYPLWFAQQVDGERRDVTVVTLPLLGAPWYLEELQRRAGLGRGATAAEPGVAARRVASDARSMGRPVAAANTLEPGERTALARQWRVVGIVAVEDSSGSAAISLDTAALRAAAQTVDAWRRGRGVREEADPIHDYFLRLLSCPARLLSGPRAPASASLDSLCNFR